MGYVIVHDRPIWEFEAAFWYVRIRLLEMCADYTRFFFCVLLCILIGMGSGTLAAFGDIIVFSIFEFRL